MIFKIPRIKKKRRSTISLVANRMNNVLICLLVQCFEEVVRKTNGAMKNHRWHSKVRHAMGLFVEPINPKMGIRQMQSRKKP